jgi:hypothetical protein
MGRRWGAVAVLVVVAACARPARPVLERGETVTETWVGDAPPSAPRQAPVTAPAPAEPTREVSPSARAPETAPQRAAPPDETPTTTAPTPAPRRGWTPAGSWGR